MSKNLESITGIGLYPMISLLIFVGFFTGLLLYLASADKGRLDIASRIPLQSNDNETTDQA